MIVHAMLRCALSTSAGLEVEGIYVLDAPSHDLALVAERAVAALLRSTSTCSL